MQELQVGQILGQRYRLIRVIAVGAVGVVWHAEHLTLRSPVALKVLDPLSMQGDTRQRFLTEAWTAAALRSPHVVQVLDCGIDGETPYIVMELLEGESLQERLARVVRLDALETSRVVRHIARALDRAHDVGVVHRDLKPGNVFIQTNEGDEVVKVLDFGVARVSQVQFGSSPSGITPAGVILGTPHYMSPEQVSGSGALDFRTDIWALGVVAYECLVGTPPRDGPTVHDVLAAILSGKPVIPSLNSKVPHGFDAWFARACAENPADRYESGKHAADQFSALCGVSESVRGLSAPLSASVSVPRSRAKRNRVARAVHPGNRRAASEKNGSWALRVLRPSLPVALAVASVGAVGFLLYRGADDAAATPSRRDDIQLTSARFESLNEVDQTPRSARQHAEPLAPPSSGSLSRLGPQDQKDEPPSVSPPPVDASFDAPASAQRSAKAAPAQSAKPPAKRTVTRAPEPEGPNRPHTVLDCKEPWYFDQQGRPRARPECL